MSNYIENSLLKDEQVKYLGHISAWSLLPTIILGFLTVWIFGLGLIFWIAAVIRYFTTELAITNKRVIAKFGFISRHTVELNMSKIESIQVDQGILGRIFDFGSLRIAGGGIPSAPVPGISNPLAFRKAFNEAQEASSSNVKVAA
jgi:uncharacterized membrane protein YdbT with pleckstrin-like domain